jgi:hypothetical protein
MKRFYIGLLFGSMLLGTAQARLVGHWPMKATKPLKMVWDARSIDAEKAWRNGWAPSSGVHSSIKIMSDDKIKAWAVSGGASIFSSKLIPVDPSKQYRLTGTFRSTGKTPSRIYFGFLPILDDGNNSTQTPQHAFKKGNDGVIERWDDGSIITQDLLTGWNQSPISRSARVMGFYYDGKTNRIPDFLMYARAYGTDEYGAYLTTSEKTINLSHPIPDDVQKKLIPGVSIVKNHYAGAGSYLYSVNSYTEIPNDWTTYSAISTGDGWTQTGSRNFRPFTRYVRIMMLLNYSQDDTATIEFDNIILEEVQGDEPERITLDSNDPEHAEEFKFSLVDDGAGSLVWETSENAYAESNSRFFVNTDKTYRFSGEFRTLGDEASSVYFGPRSYTLEGSAISNNELNIYGNIGTIQEWEASTISTQETLSDWWIPDAGNEYRAEIGFYYNGKTERLPDFIWKDTEKDGVYSSVNENKIILRQELPTEIQEKIIPNITKVRCIKRSGNDATLMETNATNTLPGSTVNPELPKDTWTRLFGEVAGEAWGSTTNMFGKFARFIRFSLITNEGNTGRLQVRKLTMETVENGDHKIYDNAPYRGVAVESRHHGSNYGAIFAEGPKGNKKGALEFDGVDDYIEIGSAENVLSPDPSEWSVALWFKTKGGYSGKKAIITNYDASGAGDGLVGIWAGISTARQLFINVRGTDAPDYMSTPAGPPYYDDDEWHHVALTAKKGERVKGYVDGTLFANQPLGKSDYFDSGVLKIGALKFQNNLQEFFRGSISDVRIYDHELSKREIENLSKREDATTFLSNKSISDLNDTKNAKPFLYYWDLIKKMLVQGQPDGTIKNVEPNEEFMRPTTDIETINTNAEAMPGLLYWDVEKKKYFIGQPNGTLRPL